MGLETIYIVWAFISFCQDNELTLRIHLHCETESVGTLRLKCMEPTQKLESWSEEKKTTVPICSIGTVTLDTSDCVGS